MVLYVGEAVKIRASAVDPETEVPLDPAPTGAVVAFWAPGRNPVRDPSVRDTPDLADQAMVYRVEEQDFIHFQDTSGAAWTAGKWTFRVTVQGTTYTNWEYSTFSLKA